MAGAGCRTQLNTIAKRDGTRNCHYCNVVTTKSGKFMATRDHVIPKSLGGPNSVNNYVLACSQCNTMRGNILVYCHCEFCEKVIDDWFHDNLWSFLNMGRFRVFKDGNDWCAVFNGKRTRHKSHDACMKAMRGIVQTFYNFAERGGI